MTWRLVGARIERLAPGEGWRPAAHTRDVLRAGSAVSDTVAWAVGHGGAVWRTLDGRAWTRVAGPSTADLVAVVAQDAESAIVTTLEGQRFVTRDGGRTWTPVP